MKTVYQLSVNGCITLGKSVEENYELCAGEIWAAGSEAFIRPKYQNGVWIESASQEEIEFLRQQKIDAIEEYYTNKIAALIRKPRVNQSAFGIPIPESILSECESLRVQCEEEINKLNNPNL